MSIHSPFDENIKSAPGFSFLRNFIGFIACGAVPVFFLLSGYLGARKIDSMSVSARDYIREKIHALVLPFLAWNAAVLLLVFLAKGMGWDSPFRGSGRYFDVNFTVSSIGAALLGIGRDPIVYQFWFLRDLIIVVFLAFFLCRHVPKIPLLPWLFFFIPLPVAASLGFYLLGYQLHSYLPPGKFPAVPAGVFYCACWLLMGIGVLVNMIVIPSPLQEIGSAAFIFMLAIIAATNAFTARLSILGPAVFFVYATHEPLQTILAKSWQILHLPAYGTLLCFLLIPAVVFPLCVVAYRILHNLSPRLTAFVTGGR